MKKLVIFDLDGTLLNTISDLGAAVNYALRVNGLPEHALDMYPNMVGNGVRRLIERALPMDQRSNAMIDKMLTDFKHYYNQHKSDMTKPYEGITRLLADLRDMDVAVAVASNKYQEATEGLMRDFFPEVAFAAVEGQRPDVPIKPDPSVVFSILSATFTPKADTLYVGDSGVDMVTARRACVDSVGVTWGFRRREELAENLATYIVTEPAQILDIVRGINLPNYYNR